jgi:hypothetical protein
VKKLFDKLKLFVDAWKMWLFFCVLVGTNGLQAGLNYSSPIKEKSALKPVHVVKSTTKPSKTVIIHKVDNSYCEKLVKAELEKHFKSSRH